MADVQDPNVSHNINIEAKANLVLPTINFTYETNFAEQLIEEFKSFQKSNTTIVATTEEAKFTEFPQLQEEASKDHELKQKEQDRLTQEFEREIQRRNEAYRKQAEMEGERIRQEVEKQRKQDVDLRKQLVELAVEHQKRQVDIESKYAKRDLDRQRNLVKSALEKTRSEEEVAVNLETAVGSTHSGAKTTVNASMENRPAA